MPTHKTIFAQALSVFKERSLNTTGLLSQGLNLAFCLSGGHLSEEDSLLPASELECCGTALMFRMQTPGFPGDAKVAVKAAPGAGPPSPACRQHPVEYSTGSPCSGQLTLLRVWCSSPSAGAWPCLLSSAPGPTHPGLTALGAFGDCSFAAT